MKRYFALPVVIAAFLTSCQTVPPDSKNPLILEGDKDNNYLFDNEETFLLESPASILVYGEVKEERSIALQDLGLRSAVVKEVGMEDGDRSFIGAYRYDGYSLEDILRNIEIDKQSGFDPITDLYVKVHGKDGTYVVISWAEIFYPVHHALQIIATRVARHVPFKTPDVQFPLPERSKLVVSNDLITCRNLDYPVGIEICSYQGTFEEKEMEELYWPTLTLEGFTPEPVVLEKLPEELPGRESDMIFYGRGRGIHDVNPFSGNHLSDLLELYLKPDVSLLETGLIIASAPDGYRSVFSLSEIINRNDRLETLIIDEEDYEREGQFSLIVSGDFFSDRAMKALWKLELKK